MAHFYGFIEGQAGEATRMGSKRSGYRAWAQNTTARVQAIFHHNPHTERDEVDVTIDASTQNYGGSGRIHLAHRVDIDALFNASAAQDHRTMVQLKKASDAIQKANEYAIAFSKSKRSKRR